MPAARIAAQRGETLIHSEALLDAREARARRPDIDLDYVRDTLMRTSTPTAAVIPNHTFITLTNETARLYALEDHRIALLEQAAHEEAQCWDRDLKYALRRIDTDTYLPWSGGSDGPAGYGVLTRAGALARGWLPTHLEHADARADSEDHVLYNRAGPGETCLTRAALIEAYTSAEAHQAFRLTPDKVEPITRGGGVNPATGQRDDKYIEWVPWAPEDQPDVLPEGFRSHY